MAYREVSMWDVKTVLERLGRGESRSAIHRATGHSRRTIARIEERALAEGWTPSPDTPVQEGLAGRVARAGSPARNRQPGESQTLLGPHRDRIVAWLTPSAGERTGLQLVKVHTLLAREGVNVPYASLHRFAVQHCGFHDRRRITVRLDDPPPGEVAQVDFGRLGYIPGAEGKKRLVWALLVVLPHSRHQYVHVTHSQRFVDVIRGLEAAWRFFVGVPRRVIVDNMKAAVVTADRYEPLFNRAFERYASYRGFTIDATRSRDPKGKPHVERGVPYVRENFFRGESWLDLEHVQREAIRWCLTTAGLRTHGTTRKRPLRVFEQVEQSALQPLVAEPYDPPTWSHHKVHIDHDITVDGARYTLPTRFIGKTMTIEATSGTIRVYYDHEHVRTYARAAPGERVRTWSDYPQERTPYAMRDIDGIQRAAENVGPETATFARRLFDGPVPWTALRQGQALLRLDKTYGPARLEAAAARANQFQLRNVKRLETILKNALDQQAAQHHHQERAATTSARFARPNSAFRHDPDPSTPEDAA